MAATRISPVRNLRTVRIRPRRDRTSARRRARRWFSALVLRVLLSPRARPPAETVGVNVWTVAALVVAVALVAVLAEPWYPPRVVAIAAGAVALTVVEVWTWPR